MSKDGNDYGREGDEEAEYERIRRARGSQGNRVVSGRIMMTKKI